MTQVSICVIPVSFLYYFGSVSDMKGLNELYQSLMSHINLLTYEVHLLYLNNYQKKYVVCSVEVLQAPLKANEHGKNLQKILVEFSGAASSGCIFFSYLQIHQVLT